MTFLSINGTKHHRRALGARLDFLLFAKNKFYFLLINYSISII